MIKRALTPDSYELHSKRDLYQTKHNPPSLPEWVLQLKNLQRLKFWREFGWVQGMILFSLIHSMMLAYLMVLVTDHRTGIQTQKNSERQIRQELKTLRAHLEKLQTQSSQPIQSEQSPGEPNSNNDPLAQEDELSKIGPIIYWGSIQTGGSYKALIEIDNQSSLFKLGQRIGEHYSIKHFDQERLVLESKHGQQRIVLMEQSQ